MLDEFKLDAVRRSRFHRSLAGVALVDIGRFNMLAGNLLHGFGQHAYLRAPAPRAVSAMPTSVQLRCTAYGTTLNMAIQVFFRHICLIARTTMITHAVIVTNVRPNTLCRYMPKAKLIAVSRDCMQFNAKFEEEIALHSETKEQNLYLRIRCYRLK